MNRSALALGIVAAALTSCAAHGATTFMSIDFTGDTNLSAPAVTNVIADPIVRPYSIGGYTAGDVESSPPTPANGKILVLDDGAMSKAMVMTTTPTNAEQGALYMDTQFNKASQWISLSFDLKVRNAPTIATAQTKTLNGGPATAGILLGMNTFGTAQGARFAAAPTSANGGVFAIRSPDNTDLQSFFNYTEGQAYHITLESNYDTGLVSTFVDNVYTGDLSFATGPASNVATQEFFFHLNGDLGSGNSVAIDNIVAAVPEPTGIALLGLGAGALLLRRSRRTPA